MLGYLCPLACLLAAGSLAFAQAGGAAEKPAAAAAAAAATQPAGAAGGAGGGGGDLTPRVKLETSLGDIVLELDAEKAPITVDNFLTYVESGHYNGLIFHRIMPNFMIQGGGYNADMQEKKDGLRAGIKNEWKNGLKNKRGTIAMARMGGQPDSATAQFFINVVDNPALDQARDGAAYAVFGKVVEGMDVVDKIKDTPTTEHPNLPMGKVVPVTPVVIKKAGVLGKADREKIKAAVKSVEDREKNAAEAEVKDQQNREKEFAAAMEKQQDAEGRKLEKTASGLMYVVLRPGAGERTPKPTDTVEVHYTGWLLSGKEFDSSVRRGESISFPLNGVIKGWTEGVGMMKVGEKRRLFIPSDMAYGPQGRPPVIPPNSMLVFDVELLKIK